MAYRCTQVELDRLVAVKVLTIDLDENRPRFECEQRATAKLTGHPNIVAVPQVGETYDGNPCLVVLRTGRVLLSPKYGSDPWPGRQDVFGTSVRHNRREELAHLVRGSARHGVAGFVADLFEMITHILDG